MAHIAIVNVGLHGHVNPTLGITDELARRGHEISYFCDPAFAHRVERTGARFFAYGSCFGQEAPTQRRDPRTRILRFAAEAEATLPHLLEALARERPDLVLYDFIAVGARLAIERLGLPAVKFYTSYAATEGANVLGDIFPFHSDPETEREVATRMEDLARSAGLPRFTLRSVMTRPDAVNLVFMPKSFHPRGEAFDERFHFVGPCLRPVDEGFADQLSLKGQEPLMLVSLGTLFHDWPEFYRDAIAAFGDRPWRVAMSVGPRIDVSQLGRVPENVFIRPHLPQLDLLAMADVFVSHGGMNSTMEALSFGVPLVMIPQMEEQAMTARRVEELGLGAHLARESVTPAALLNAVEKVAGDAGIRTRVARMREEVRAAGGTPRAVAVIEGAVRARSSRAADAGRATEAGGASPAP